jgi:hypothetical protein
MKAWSAVPWVILAMVIATGCSDAAESDDESDSTPGELNDECSSNSDCIDELFCPKSGRFEGLCSVACEEDQDCSLHAGSRYYCLNGVCATACNDDCGFGAVESSCSAGFTCVSQSVLDGMAYSCDVSWCVPR